MTVRSIPNGDTAWGADVRAAIAVTNGLEGTTSASIAAALDARDTRLGALEAKATPVRWLRGINMAGAEFAASASTLPGTSGTDYAFDSAAAYAAVAARGHALVRLPFRWERLQPTRAAALSTTTLGLYQQAVADVRAAGMVVDLDAAHNYGRYINSTANGGAELVLGDTLPVAHLVDFWTRVSAAFKNDPGVHGYCLMNEPHDLPGVTGGFSGTVRYDFASGVQGWTGGTAAGSNVGGALRATQSLGSGSVNLRIDDAATVAGGTGPTGSVIRYKLTPVALPAGTWTAKAQWQNSSYSYQEPTAVSMTRVDTGAAVTSLTVGVAVYVTSTFSSIASPPQAFAIEVDGTGATAGTVTVDIDDFAQGALTGGMTAAARWVDTCQQIVDAIRANGDTKHIRIPAHGYSGAQRFLTEHPAGITIRDPLNNWSVELHYYPDGNNSGTFGSSYAAENTAAVSAGYASLQARVRAELLPAFTWARDHNVKLLLGETGWPNTGDTASWNAVGEVIYGLCDDYSVDVTVWAGGARWGDTYPLSVYTGTAQATVKSQASVVEAHPTAVVDAGKVAARVTALEQGSSARHATPHRGPAFMAIGATTPSELATAKANGATHGLVQVFWDQVQSSAGGPVDASGTITNISNVVAAGLRPCLRVSLQYPPTFVQTGCPKFKQQSGAEWTGTQANGDNIRDWVWSRTGRSYVADLYTKLFAQLDWSKIERVQIGGLRAGELSYPVTDGTVWWGFGSAAQSGGSDLAPRMAVCPVPGTTPSTGTTWTDNDRKIIGWYLQSLSNWMTWCIEQHRRWFGGDIWVMHPGFGLRTYMDPTGSGAAGYREMVANGLDWAGQIGCYPDEKVHPYSTWIDGAHNGAQIYSLTNDGDAAAWLHLLKTARRLGRAGRIWGENTGGQSNTDMDAVFLSGAVAHGYEGVTWLDHTSLTSSSGDTYANFATRITAAS